MFLTSLTMRGFKSFADTTALEVEPGITVVVGPNGSGKSNIVDALSWVLGTHSVKKVRGSAMTDVIFAGAPGRARGRRARVEIVIDNADGRLATSGVGTAGSAGRFREVRIARTIEEDGLGVYEINGEEVRALDVQELLSDTGLGRELHTIVGQGQLDEILNARPEERRKYIEEAAGILKHRRRRERAVKKLETVDEHVDKLRTVLRELRRQLRPLEQQAKAADRHAALQAELREVRVQRAARELALVDLEASDAGHEEEAVRARETELEQTLSTGRRDEQELSQQLDVASREGGEGDERFHALSRLTERLRGTHDLIGATRRRLAEAAEEPLLERSGDALRAEADAVEASRDRLERACVDAAADHDAARDALREAERARDAHADARAEHQRARAVADERRTRRRVDLAAVTRRIEERGRELERATTRLDALEERDAQLAGDMDRIRDDIHRLDAGEATLAEALDVAEAKLHSAQVRLDAVREDVRARGSERAAQLARAEALRASAADASRSAEALVEAGLPGVHGGVMGMLEVDAADRLALATALGPLGAAVAVAEQDALTRAVEWLRSNKGAASLLVARDGAGGDHDEPDAATAERLRSAGARAVREVVRAGATSPAARRVAETLGQVLATTFVVVDWATAVTLHRESPRLTFVTRDGDVAGPLGYRIGTVGNAGPALARAAAEEAEAAVATLEAELAAFAEQEAQLASEIVTRTAQRDEAQEALLESDARLTGAAERLERIDEERRILVEQRAALTTQSEEVGAVLTDDRSTLATLEAEESADRSEEDGSARDAHATDLDMRAAALDAALVAAREASFEARIALQRAEDARDRTTAEAARLRGEAEAIDLAHARAVARREDRRAGVVRCDALDRVTTLARSVLERALVEADEARATRLAERDRFRTLLDEARESVGDTARALEQHREIRHRTELRRAEVHSRLAALEARIRTELALGLDDVRSDQPDAAELDDARLVEREDVLVRRLGLLGRVNPLALEEFQALEERHRFLSDQLNDLRRSRQDLEEVIGAVDERIRVVFKEAFDDIAREFQLTFETMFPGGKGRLVLTGAEDLLTAGVEVEARPGKKVQRLSLLSGGERSLTVLAFVFAIFRARPSPFYVLDEVDAALDDVNLQRLLKVIRSFRGNAQVIMVTHQKRSMEIADLLYGITMGPDAVTKVVSERLRDRRAVAALDERASDAPTAALDEQAAATAPAGTA